jgi:hypothetical protein
LYRVSLNKRAFASVDRLSNEHRQHGTVPIYCVTTSTGYFLIRHKDRVSVTGNSSYLMTPWGMQRNYPEQFKKLSDAQALQRLLFQMAPGMRQWQKDVIQEAVEWGYLGGPPRPDGKPGPTPHPFGYRHAFYEAQRYERQGSGWVIKEGEDAKRCVAFGPQSIARGVLTNAMMRLMDPECENYVGDTCYGKTPIRALIHDSGLFEVESRFYTDVLVKAYNEMTKPVLELPCPEEWGMGPYLSIGVEMKVGKNWADMEKVLPYVEPGVASDLRLFADYDEEEEAWD